MPPVPVLRPGEVVKTLEKLGNLTDESWLNTRSLQANTAGHANEIDLMTV